MTLAFTYDALPGRVVFGPGARHQLADELNEAGSTRTLIIASRRNEPLVSEMNALLGDRVVGRYHDVAQHVPVTKAEAAVGLAADVGADAVVALGGGSAIGFGKAIALHRDVTLVAVLTTYSGSEMTPIWGMTDGDGKRTGRSLRAKPSLVIYDPELTVGLPARIAGPSGMNALAHSVESLYGPGANPVISAIALESTRVLFRGLPAVVAHPNDVDAQADALYGAYLAGVALATAGTALHHRTCHVLGGLYGLDHGGMNAAVLGHALAYTAPAIPQVMERLGDVLGVAAVDAPGALFDLAASIGAPTGLQALGMPEDGIDAAVEHIVHEAAANVRAPESALIAKMLDDAFHGRRPGDHR